MNIIKGVRVCECEAVKDKLMNCKLFAHGEDISTGNKIAEVKDVVLLDNEGRTRLYYPHGNKVIFHISPRFGAEPQVCRFVKHAYDHAIELYCQKD